MESTLFSETSRTEAQVHHQVFPRILAFAERAWHKATWEAMTEGAEQTKEFDSDWAEFARTVSEREFNRLQRLDIHYRIPTPAARLLDGVLQVGSEFPDLSILYSVDNGQTWGTVTPGVPIGSEVTQVLLRTSSKDGTRFSRTVTLNTRAAEELRPSIQATLDYIGQNLEVTVSVLDNYERYGDGFYLGRLRLRNTGQTSIAPGDWRIYFGTLKMIEPETLLEGRTFIFSDQSMSVHHIQGPLVSLGPTASFMGLGPGADIHIDFKGQGSSVSKDDFLPNWYVSAPGLNPRDIVSTTNGTAFVSPFETALSYLRTKQDPYRPWSPEARYDRNAAWDVSYDESSVSGVLPSPVIARYPDGQTYDLIDLLQGPWALVGVANVVDVFREWMTKLLPEVKLTVPRTNPTDKYIQFTQGVISESDHLEAYSIRVLSVNKRVEVVYRTEQGAFRAVMTIVQLALKTLPNKPRGSLRESQIVDWPRFEYRGFYLDTARFFMPKDSVLRLLDVMSVYKLNKLHLHLSDDEGWRLDIPGLPELTQVGSKRCRDQGERDCLLDTLGSESDSIGQTDQFYTATEFEEILRHALRRHIEVIPEFDMPGHSRASIQAMVARWQNLNDIGHASGTDLYLLHELQDSTRYTAGHYYTDNVVNPCLASTYTFLETVYNGVNTMYRNVGLAGVPALHLGGEGVPQDAWLNASSCQTWRQGGHQFVVQASTRLSGASIAVWEDALFADPRSRTPTPMSQFPRSHVTSDVYRSVADWDQMWRPYTLANAGYKVIMAPATHVFFDHPQEPDPAEGGNVWAARYVDTFKTFSFMPFRYYDNAKTKFSGEEISRDFICKQDNSGCPELESPENVIGMKAVLPAVMVKSVEEFESQVYPRLLALAERAWHGASWENVTDEGQRETEMISDWARFANSLGKNDLALLDACGVKYRVPPPGVRLDKNRLKTNVEFPGLKVQFRTEGVSSSSWLELTPDIKFDADRNIRLRTISPDGAKVSREVKVKVTTSSTNQPDGTAGLEGSRSTVLVMVGLVVAVVTGIRNLVSY